MHNEKGRWQNVEQITGHENGSILVTNNLSNV